MQRHTRIIMALLLALTALTASAYDKTTTSLLDSLNRIIERRDTYYTMHQWQIDSVKRVLAQTPVEEKSRRAVLLHDIFSRYKSFQGDSALSTAEREIALAQELDDRDALVRAKTDKLLSLVSTATFTDALDLVRSTDLSGTSNTVRGQFYFVCIRMFSDLSNYYGENLRARYTPVYRAYADSVIATMPANSYEAQYASIFKSLDDMTDQEKIKVFEKLLASNIIDNQDLATISSIIADIHLRMGNRIEGLRYKVRAAIYDITYAKRETSALQSIAEMVFQDGQYEEASRYINLALADADFFNAPQHKSDIAIMLRLIESQRYASMDSRRKAVEMAFIVCLALFIIAVVAIVFYIRAARRLAESNKLLNKRHEELKHLNEKLEEANENTSQANAKLQETLQKMQEIVRIKDEYLGYSLYTNSEYIKRIENLHNLVKAKLRNKQYDTLAQAIKEQDITAERKKILKDFDHAFLRIFPHFVEKYEELFDHINDEEPHGRKGDSDSLLTPEMRIFAMIRLGVTDISKIALFLDYSVNTVNTYKTRAKNKSRLPNDQFEAAIMNIKSV